jgi:non-hemolytic enterotoxin B/C
MTGTNSTITSAQQIATANTQQSSQGVILQNYCNSVLTQPNVNLSGFTNLQQYQTQINGGLSSAQSHASLYLKTVQPQIITNIANIQNYFQLHQAVATALPPGATTQDWLSTLSALQEQAQEYQNQAQSVISNLSTFHDNVAADAAAFASYVSELNTAVNGDNGMLASISSQLGTIQSDINGAIAGTVLSGLAIMGGIFMTAVGGVAEFVTAGTSTPLVVAGIAVVAAGVGGEVASALALKNLNDQKASLLQQRSTLTAEVNLATGLSSGIGNLQGAASSSVTAASQMENAWGSLNSDLGNLASDLQKGITNTGFLRTLFLTTANTEIQTVLTDTATIKTQMSGVQSLVAPANSNIGDFIVSVAQQNAA